MYVCGYVCGGGVGGVRACVRAGERVDVWMGVCVCVWVWVRGRLLYIRLDEFTNPSLRVALVIIRIRIYSAKYLCLHIYTATCLLFFYYTHSSVMWGRIPHS